MIKGHTLAIKYDSLGSIYNPNTTMALSYTE